MEKTKIFGALFSVNRLKGVFIEGSKTYIRQKVRNYWTSNQDGDLLVVVVVMQIKRLSRQLWSEGTAKCSRDRRSHQEASWKPISLSCRTRTVVRSVNA